MTHRTLTLTCDHCGAIARRHQADELDDARALADRQSGIVVALLPEGGE